jgi:hypothetical protein
MNLKNLFINFGIFYKASPENRTGVHLVLGFIVVPAIVLSLALTYVFKFYL